MRSAVANLALFMVVGGCGDASVDSRGPVVRASVTRQAVDDATANDVRPHPRLVRRWFVPPEHDVNGAGRCAIGPAGGSLVGCRPADRDSTPRVATNLIYMGATTAGLDGSLSCATVVCRRSDRRSALFDMGDIACSHPRLGAIFADGHVLMVRTVCGTPEGGMEAIDYVDRTVAESSGIVAASVSNLFQEVADERR